MKNKISYHVRLPRRLYQVILDIRHKFVDYSADDPYRGATTRALEYIIQYYLNSEDYEKLKELSEESARRALEYLHQKEAEIILKKMKDA